MNNILEKYREEFKSSENDAYLNSKSLCNVGVNLLLDAIQAEYDKLCPRSEEFENYQWCAIDRDGKSYFYYSKPMLNKFFCWVIFGDALNAGKKITLPLGLDWRLCCWSIEDAKRIHGEE